MIRDHFNGKIIKKIIHKDFSDEDLSDETNVKNLLEDIFSDLLIRKESSKNGEICTFIFRAFLDLPILVSNKIFSVFDIDKNGFLSKTEFVNGIYNLYFNSSLENMLEITFRIYKEQQNNVITSRDVKLFLSYFTIEDKIIERMESAVDRFFGSSSTLNSNEFKENILEKNSNIFILLLIYLNLKQPLSREVIKFYIENKNKIIFEKVDKQVTIEAIKESDFISFPK